MNKLLDSSLTRGFSRRSFLVGLGATAALPILAACQPQVVEKTVEVPVIVKETVVVQEIVEKEVVVERAVEVEKEVIVEREVVVEVEKEVTRMAGPPMAKEPITLRHHTAISVMKPQIELYSLIDNNVTINFEAVPWAQHADKWLIDVAAGSAADYVTIGSPWWPPLKTKQVTYALDDHLRASGLENDRFSADPQRFMGHNGKLWGLPFAPTNPRTLIYNIGLYESAGVDLPTIDWTWDDLTAALKELHNPPDVYGMPTLKNPWTPQEMIWQKGGALFNEDQSKCLLDSQEAISAIQQAVDWTVKDKVAMAPGQEKVLGDNIFGSNKLSNMVSSGLDWDALSKRWTKNFEFEAWSTGFPLAPDAVERVYSSEVHVRALYGQTKYPDDAFNYMQWMLSDPAALTIQFVDIGIPVGYDQKRMLAGLEDEKQKAFFTNLFDNVLPHCAPDIWGPQTSEIQGAFFAEYDFAMLEKKTVAEAMKDATTAIDAILADS